MRCMKAGRGELHLGFRAEIDKTLRAEHRGAKKKGQGGSTEGRSAAWYTQLTPFSLLAPFLARFWAFPPGEAVPPAGVFPAPGARHRRRRTVRVVGVKKGPAGDGGGGERPIRSRVQGLEAKNQELKKAPASVRLPTLPPREGFLLFACLYSRSPWIHCFLISSPFRRPRRKEGGDKTARFLFLPHGVKGPWCGR